MDFFRKLLDTTRNDDLYLSLLLLNLPYLFFLVPCLAVENITGDILLGALGRYFVPTFVLSLFFLRAGKLPRRVLLVLTGTVSALDIVSVLLLHQPFYLSYLPSLFGTNAAESTEFLEGHLRFSFENMALVTCCVPMFSPSVRKRIFHLWTRFCDAESTTVALLVVALAFGYLYGISAHLLTTRMPQGNNLLRISLDAMDQAMREKPRREKVIPEVLSADETIPYVVVVLGESANKHHHAVYGYELPTTPWADSEQAKGNLAVYTDVLATQHYTIAAMKDIFSDRKANDRDTYESVPSIFDYLRQTKYHTVWLSNQENVGVIGKFENQIAEECDEAHFTHPASANTESNPVYDEALLPLFDSQMAVGKPNQFLILHLMGSHQRAKNRYPESFAKFHPEDEPPLAEPDADAMETKAAYDNSVLYTDEILREVTGRLEHKDAVVIYFSDHGEDVYDYELRYFAGHTPQGSDEELYVPFYVWGSPIFQKNHKEAWNRVQDAKTFPMKTDFFPEFLWNLLQLRAS